MHQLQSGVPDPFHYEGDFRGNLSHVPSYLHGQEADGYEGQPHRSVPEEDGGHEDEEEVRIYFVLPAPTPFDFAQGKKRCVYVVGTTFPMSSSAPEPVPSTAEGRARAVEEMTFSALEEA